jgi:hypothetical protein
MWLCETEGMTLTVQQVELGAHDESIRLEAAELVDSLRSILGAQLVAYIAAVNETRAVREWAEGVRRPRPAILHRLRTTYRAALFLERREGRAIVQAWFQGLNPSLNDRSPARVLREGDGDEAGIAVLAAARSFAATA